MSDKDVALAGFSDRESAWAQESRDLGRQLLTIYAGTSEVTPNALDTAFRRWKADDVAQRPADNVVACGLGILFGDYVIAHRGGDWRMQTDAYGTDAVVVGPANVKLFPVASVSKRMAPDNGDIAFFKPIWASLPPAHLPDPTPPVPWWRRLLGRP